MAKAMILAVFLALVWFGFGLSEAIAWFPITSNCFFYTQHVTVAQKLAKPMVMGLFLVSDWFRFRLFLGLIQILNALAEPLKINKTSSAWLV